MSVANSQSSHPNWRSSPVRASFLVLVATAASLSLSGCDEYSGDTRQAYSVTGTVSGLDSGQLVLAVNGNNVVIGDGATAASLATTLVPGADYTVTVASQPPGEMCTVVNGSGTITSANVGNVVVTCSDKSYPLNGTISGLNGAGLVLANGSDTLTVPAGATSFTMPTHVAYTSSYDVVVKTQPAGESCAIYLGNGTMPASAVYSVSVQCTDQPFTLGGTISGLGANTGLVLVNGSDTLPIPANSNSFAMPTTIAFGSPYDVTVQSNPIGMICSPSQGSGTMGSADITHVAITCSDQGYSLGGTLSGLSSSGLVLADGTDTVSVSPGAQSFTLSTPVAYTSPYNVIVQTQPTGQTCSVSNGSSTMPAAAVNNVSVACSTNTYTIGGTISGLTGTGLVLLDNAGDATSIAANAGQFTMNTGLAYDSSYAVTVRTEPSGQVCEVSNGSGPVGAGDVTTVSIDCVSNFELLHTFTGGSDGAEPYHSLIQANDGNFYGTTFSGGASNGGVVFEVSPTGTESVFYSFPSMPLSGLIQGTDGDFYGTTAWGGAHNTGTLFRLTPNATYTLLYSFAAGASDPFCGVIQGMDGNFYGTTGALGQSDDGTVFEITYSDDTYTALHTFPKSGSDGQVPYAGVIQGTDGNLYGTTYGGGAHGDGTVWKITLGGTETILYSFQGGTDGASPYAGVTQGPDGNFYGTTYAGGAHNLGTVYKVTPGGSETVLYSFSGSSDGASPQAGITFDSSGNLYGITYAGGTNGAGTVFEITSSGTEITLHTFVSSTDGGSSNTNLVLGADGNLYGSAAAGGASGDGTFFKVSLH